MVDKFYENRGEPSKLKLKFEITKFAKIPTSLGSLLSMRSSLIKRT